MQNRKYFFGVLIILFTLNSAYAQINWQQQINFTIEVTLNDQTNDLHGFESFMYKNNSPQALAVIYMHLWPNAYKDRSSALDKQKINSGDIALHYADEENTGFIDSLSFAANGIALKLLPFNKESDIAILQLNEMLQPGDSVFISTPFHVKIPANYSRLGHVGESYQISQWYPKPAVYDQNGWHPLTYLDQGEFYSEFGSYEVRITLPENYVVGATGVLQEQSEIDFLDRLSKDSILASDRNNHIQFPASAKVSKTITYKQDHIHDFAWFADKRFYVRKGMVELPKSKRKVTTYVMFTASKVALWEKGIDYINRSILYYSDKVGEYPYDFCTAIDGTISAGGGMEYPMVTCIGDASSAYELDIVIAHEVGHNWFYGILANNEREYPWMDEGINSFYENAYSEKYYPNINLYETILGNTFIARLLGVEKIKNTYSKKLFYLYSAALNKDQSNSLTSASYSTLNYGCIIYSKSVLILEQLKSFMGEEAFDAAMHDFYQSYMFQHISPEDFKNIFSKYSKQDINWFFTELLNDTKKQKVKISHLRKNTIDKTEIQIVNKGKTQTPIPLKLEYIDGTSITEWFQMPSKKLDIDLSTQNLKSVSVLQDAHNINLFSSSNTAVLKNDKFHLLHPVAVKMIGLLREPGKQQLNILPSLGWNNGDKLMLGVLFYSSIIPSPKFEYAITPMFGLGSLRPIGILKLAYHIFPAWAESITFKLNGQSFSYNNYYNIDKQKTLATEYYTLAYTTEIVFKNKNANSNIHKSLSGRAALVYESFENDFRKGEKTYHFFNTNELKFNWKNSKKINPYNFSMALQQCKDFMTASATANFYVSYNKAKSFIRFRFFAGTFLYQKNAVIDKNKGLLPPNRSLTMSSNGAVGNYRGRNNEDFTYDAIYLDRSGMDPVFSHQVFTNKEGGFRSMIGTGLGNSSKWLMSINISAKLPKRIPLKPFVTIGTGYLFNEKSSTFNNANFLSEAGFSLVIFEDIFEIHFPLLVTNNIKNNQNFNFGIDKFYERITFTLDFNLLNPFEKIKNLKF